MVSGGKRPTASQNNPANVSATGGNGQNGSQAMQWIPGMKDFNSTGEETLAQQRGASMYKAPSPGEAEVPRPKSNIPFGALLSDEADNLPVTDGINRGPGKGEQALPPQFRTNARRLENVQVVKKYMPVLLMGASMPDAPDSFKQFVGFLEGQVWE